MKCYFHSELDAVASCSRCNKFICKQCYDMGSDGLCAECSRIRINENLDEIRLPHRLYVRNSLVSLVVGAIIGFIGSIILLYGIEDLAFTVGFLTTISAYTGFSIYCGARILSFSFAPFHRSGCFIIITWPVLLFIFLASATIGFFASIPKFIYHLILSLK